MKLDVERRTPTLRTPLQSAYGAVVERELLVVALSDRDGVVGYGEAAPLESYDGVSIERAHGALERYAPVLARSEGMNGAQLIEALSTFMVLQPGDLICTGSPSGNARCRSHSLG